MKWMEICTPKYRRRWWRCESLQCSACLFLSFTMGCNVDRRQTLEALNLHGHQDRETRRHSAPEAMEIRFRHEAAVLPATSPSLPASSERAFDKFVRVLWIVVVVGVCAGCGLGALSFLQIRRAEAPYDALRSFVERESVERDLSEVGELRVDELKLFAQAGCAQGPDVPTMKIALTKQLRGVPQRVVEEVVDSALVEGVSSQNTIQNTTTGVEADGRAYSYLAFWSTEFNGDHAYLAAVYSTCVMVSGVEIEVGEDVAEWETSVQPRVVGHQPCHCGWVYCSECPIFKEVTTRRPIMKRHRLTLRNQLDLHHWMVKRAVDQASVLVETRRAVGGGTWRLPGKRQLTSTWEGPTQYSYQGDDSERTSARSAEL